MGGPFRDCAAGRCRSEKVTCRWGPPQPHPNWTFAAATQHGRIHENSRRIIVTGYPAGLPSSHPNSECFVAHNLRGDVK